MHTEQGHLYHFYNQGNNQEILFHDDSDYKRFISLAKLHLKPVCEIIAWCLMPNHFHFCIKATEFSVSERLSGRFMIQAFSVGVGKMLSAYAGVINAKYGTSGGRFRPKSKLKLLTADSGGYSKEAIRYIHNNPVVAGLCVDPVSWLYSSAQDYAGLRNGTLCNLRLAKELGFL